MKIERIIAREIYDSEGWPTVQCEIILNGGDSVIASVPSGISVGSHEALEMHDGGTRFNGRGVQRAVENIERIIAPLFIGKEPNALEMDIQMIELDGTEDKSRLGSNALLATSMALYRAEAFAEDVELYEFIAGVIGAQTVSIPFPLLNVINGGAHVSNKLRFQEFLLMPIGAQTFRSAFEVAVLTYHELGEILKKLGRSVAVGPEGGYACSFKSEEEALDLLLEAIEKVNSRHALSCVLALDVAASEFYDEASGLYQWHDTAMTSDELIAYYEKLATQYPIYSIEDGLSQDDWEGWQKLTKAFEQKLQVVGDDLTATNLGRILFASEEQPAVTSVIIKPNQVGTITETIQAIMVSKERGINTIVSHRSRETEDTFIADLAVGTSAGQIKAGSCSRSERLAKYNRLLAIEDTLTFSQFDT